MYTNRPRFMGDFSTVLSDILNTGEKIVRDVTMPVITNPALNLPTPPFIDPRTGQIARPATSDYTIPLMIGGGLLLVLLLTRGRSAKA